MYVGCPSNGSVANCKAIKRIGKEVMTAQLSLSLMATDEGRREGAVASSTG